MTEALWTAVDHYIDSLLVPPDAALDAAIETSTAAGLPPINVTPLAIVVLVVVSTKVTVPVGVPSPEVMVTVIVTVCP